MEMGGGSGEKVIVTQEGSSYSKDRGDQAEVRIISQKNTNSSIEIDPKNNFSCFAHPENENETLFVTLSGERIVKRSILLFCYGAKMQNSEHSVL